MTQPLTTAFLAQFKWASKAQEEGYYHFVQWHREHFAAFEPSAEMVALFLIQKSHESAEWWAGVVGDQMALSRQDLRVFALQVNEKVEKLRADHRKELVALKRQIEALKKKTRTPTK